MTPEDIHARTKSILVQRLCVEEAKIAPGTNLVEDLGCDSLDEVDIVMAIENEFGIEISDEEAEGITTVSDIEALLIRKLA